MGLDIPDLWQEDDWKVRIAQIKDSVADLFNFINPGVEYKLGFVKHLNGKMKAARQIVEVTLESEKMGKSIRRAYSEKIKLWREKKLFPDRMNGVSITPSLTLATRVRIAILKAIAKMMPKEFEETEAWVISTCCEAGTQGAAEGQQWKEHSNILRICSGCGLCPK